MDCTSH